MVIFKNNASLLAALQVRCRSCAASPLLMFDIIVSSHGTDVSILPTCTRSASITGTAAQPILCRPQTWPCWPRLTVHPYVKAYDLEKVTEKLNAAPSAPSHPNTLILPTVSQSGVLTLIVVGLELTRHQRLLRVCQSLRKRLSHQSQRQTRDRGKRHAMDPRTHDQSSPSGLHMLSIAV